MVCAVVEERKRSRDRQVAGTVQLMTDEPVVVPPLAQLETLRHRWTEELSRRPWIVPALLVGAAALVLLLRRR